MKFHDGAAAEPLKPPPERLITETAESLGERLNSVFSALFIFFEALKTKKHADGRRAA